MGKEQKYTRKKKKKIMERMLKDMPTVTFIHPGKLTRQVTGAEFQTKQK